MNSEKIYNMKFSKVYPLLLNKIEKKGRSKEELDRIIQWLTGYDASGLQRKIEQDSDYATFFREAPAMNPDAEKITGVICGVRVEEIEDPIVRQVRQLDKMVDELAKGKKMEKILRNHPSQAD